LTVDRRTFGFLEDMLEHAEYAEAFVAGFDRAGFELNREKQFAVVRALEIIGEAAKSVPQPIRDLAPGIPWRQMASMRDKLIHHYFGVDLEIVWGTVTTDIPSLIAELRVLLPQLTVE